MATVVKNFRIKSGLVVEGTTGTIDSFDILTKKEADIDYIIEQVGGSGVSTNTPNTLVLRDGSGNFAAGTITANLTGNVSGNVTGDLTGNADTASALETARTIELTGDVTGSVSFDGSQNVQISTTLDADFATNAEVATAKSEAIADANTYTDTAVAGAIDDIPVNTDELSEGATNLYYTDARARAAVSAGDGLDYDSNTGVFTADLGYGLQIDGNGQIEVDGSVIATDIDVSNAIGAHSDLTTGVHGVTGNVVGTSDVQTLENKTLGEGTVLSANLYADGFTIAGLAEPVNASDAATKGYVDAVVEGLHVHQSVVAATTANVDLATGGLLTVDGVTLVGGDRVLVKAQSAPAENGIYIAASGAWTRAEDYDTAVEIQAGDFVFVSGGTLYNSTGWVQENPVTTLGTDPIVWDQFSGAGEYTAGNGLSLNGAEFSIDTTVTATKSYVDDEIDGHAELTTGVHGVTGNIVGTSDTQSLTNKTLGSGTALAADVDAVNTYTVKNLATPVNAADAATKGYVDGEISTVNGTISALDTDDIAEGSNLYFTNQRAIDAVGGTIGDAIDALDTDDIEEGTTNLYFTDGRAKDSAASLLTSATLTNITITGTGSGLTITAENGVADSTTDNLAEGSTNLYFTNQRALDATAAAYDPAGSASAAESNAETFTTNAINALDTDDIEEGAANLYFTNQRALDATSSAYDASGAAAQALSDAEDYADSLAANYDPAGSASTAETNAKSYTDSLIGDVTVDGTSGNTVTDRIATAVSNLVDAAPSTLDTLNELAAALQDNPDVISDLQSVAAGKQDTLTAGANIDITGATISVTGLDTADVAEDPSRLYFTDARAVTALEAVVPNFTEVDLNSVATQVAATTNVTASTVATVYSFSKNDYRSAKFLVKLAAGTHTEVSEVLLTLDSSDNIAITEYAVVGTNGSMSTISATISGGSVALTVNAVNNSTVTVMGTLLA